jgi:hypothetical protein
VIVAPATAAPLGSVMRPWMVPRNTCALSIEGNKSTDAANMKQTKARLNLNLSIRLASFDEVFQDPTLLQGCVVIVCNADPLVNCRSFPSLKKAP